MASFKFDMDKDANNFMNFVNELRSTLRDQNNKFLVDGVGRLTAEVDVPDTIDLVLHAGDKKVTLRLRVDNLYVIGFSNTAGRWFEFQHDNNMGPMIQGSTSLTYNGSYTSNGIGSLNTSEAIIGRPAVLDAINGLANFSGTTDDSTRRNLRALIVNFIESIRFHSIADRVALHMSSSESPAHQRRLTLRDIGVIRSWGSMSRALRINVMDPQQNTFRAFNHLQIQNRQDVAAVLAMALIGILKNNMMQRQRCSLAGNGVETVGLTLLEVQGVKVQNIDGEHPGQLYGVIAATDGFFSFDMYRRQKENPQKVYPGGWADITWPRRVFAGTDSFVLDVNLKDYDRFSPDDEVASGQVMWNPRDALRRYYDTTIKKVIRGQYGSAEVHYAVLTDAVVAELKIVLESGDGEGNPDVYGTIAATTTMASGEQLKLWPFKRERGNCLSVPIHTAIPLQRTVISAPLCSELHISADLWDMDHLPDPSPDDQIVKGSVSFTPHYSGEPRKVIDGPNGKVTVIVTWSTTYD
ncbi:hypothetical protein ACP70R_022808 [Stipagrostis hirtigluma subsp. patula]